MKTTIRNEIFFLIVASALAYLPFVLQFGYYNDDWYLMYAAGAKGATIFADIYSVDRPMRALVMVPAYFLFGPNPVYYDISVYFFRILSALGFLWIFRLLWPECRANGLFAALLFSIYPGFLSQFNGIDYQSQMVSLAVGMFSVALTIRAFQSTRVSAQIGLNLLSGLLMWFYLGLVEYFIGLEVFRLLCIAALVVRTKRTWLESFYNIVRKWIIPLTALLLFIIWRFFIFKSERGATDANLQLEEALATPKTFLFKVLSTLTDDFLDVFLRAWEAPFRRLSGEMNGMDWVIGVGITVLVLALIWMMFSLMQKSNEQYPDPLSRWRWEELLLGLGAIIFGLLPIMLVGRTVDFKSFSRYGLIASVGVVILWQVFLNLVQNIRLRNVLFSVLIISSSLTHYANGLKYVHDTKATQNFWWQVSWRIPQFDQGATLIAHYSVPAEEDYFTWGPANLIYYPQSVNERYLQPGLHAAILNDETVQKVINREPQEFDNRRTIRTYKNYRNILVITQPTPSSCVQIIDQNQIELSSFEDPRVVSIAPFSEASQIYYNDPLHTPPPIPFGEEPPHEWCYYYETASLARQKGDWNLVAILGDEAALLGFVPFDQIEWMPFLQGYAMLGNMDRLSEIESRITDANVREQACRILTEKDEIAISVREKITSLFCE